MQSAFRTKDRGLLPLFAGLHGARGLVSAAFEMGEVRADSPWRPTCAAASVGDFLFLGGQPGRSARHLLRVMTASSNRAWIIQGQDAWMELFRETLPGREAARIEFDHAVQPEDARLDRLLADMPAGCTLEQIGDGWYDRCLAAPWMHDFVSNYDREAYARTGLGVLLLEAGEPVSGASGYVSYPGGIEIQVETRADRQGRGYAMLSSAYLVRLCHQRGLAATWDAANEASARLAEKLGYRRVGPYPVWQIEKK